MTDWREAGYRADAKRVLNLYRRAFDNDAKRLARSRSIEALRAAGVQTVVCLWGGGYDAEELVAAGFRVIAVDNGSMALTEGDRPVSSARKRRALQYAAEAGGYEWRWGDVSRYLHEADGALLDFHGPWASDKRRIVNAARHMTAVVVVLVPSHDVSADASSAHERQMAYQLFLKMAWAERPRWRSMQGGGHVRRLTDYHEDQGRHVFVYLLGRKHIAMLPMKRSERNKMRRDYAQHSRAISRSYYERMPEDQRLRYFARMRHQQNHVRRGRTALTGCEWCSRQPILRRCAVCDTEFAISRANQVRCSPPCTRLAKLQQERERRGRRPKGIPVERRCVVCLATFVRSGNDTHSKTCGPECRRIETRRRSREWASRYRKMRVAAVSGTAAEAVSSEEAA